ncbi:MAG: hypothetical protein JSW61_11275 [Candidatus Thorarchaeota archaeon]|nr:MAG: hypothetical protein JSW61_11275 [Candidatus Thorarchaeota archaeon]
MSDLEDRISVYKEHLKEVKGLGWFRIIIGFIASTILMVASTWGLLIFISSIGLYNIAPENIGPYTTYFLLGTPVATVVAALICILLIKRPEYGTLLMRLHMRLKHGAGEYFLSPEAKDLDLNTILRRSIYGSILVVGIALTAVSQVLLTNISPEYIIVLGGYVTLASIIILPFTMMQFYYAPWIIKESGFFHLDVPDRSFSNVGDNIEDILEFVAGVDIVLVLIELTLATDLWVAGFIFLVVLGPLLSIVLNFTLVYAVARKQATLAMIKYLLEKRQVPDILGSKDEIRQKVIALVDRPRLAKLLQEEVSTSPTEEHSAVSDIEEPIEEIRLESSEPEEGKEEAEHVDADDYTW